MDDQYPESSAHVLPSPSPLPPAFDQASFAGRFGAALHRAGVAVTPDRAACFLDALRLLPPVDRSALYWTARLAFVTGREQIELFDQVFEFFFGGVRDPADARGAPDNPPLPGVEPAPDTSPGASPFPPRPAVSPPTRGLVRADGFGDRSAHRDESVALRTLTSREESLAHKDFAVFEPGELAALDRLLGTLVLRVPLRRTRRREADPRGRRIDLRRTLRHSLRTGAEPVLLARSRSRWRRRKLVLLCDISGSMEPYTRAYLRFFSRLYGRTAATVPVETFVFATRLTRLTPILRHSSPDAALRRAGVTAPDWSGGTRIGDALAEFTNRYGRRGLARGAVLVVFSDGWEGEDPAAVGREMARLSRLTHRIVWVNPRKAAPGYAPLAAGMAAALPHCDAFVSGHSLAALTEVADAIAGTGTTPRTRREPDRSAARSFRPKHVKEY